MINKKKSIFHDYPWFMFVFGIVLGIAIFASYNYFKLTSDNSPEQAQPQSATFNITNQDHIWGNPDAKVEIVIFNDFTCPYCSEHMVGLKEFMENYKDKIKIIWRHFPLDKRNQESLYAANASECAAEQGKFWDFAHRLFEDQDNLSLNFYYHVAEELELDIDKFKKCVEDDKYAGRVEAHYSEGLAKGVEGTPANFINGRYIPGAIPYYDLKQLIDPLL